MARVGSLGEQFGVDPFEHFSNVDFKPMTEWRPGGHVGEIDEGFGSIQLSNPLAGSNVSIPVVGRHQALGPSGPFQFGEGPPFRSQGAEGVPVHHEWDFQALSEELDRPGEDETFEFEKLFADPWHPRLRGGLGSVEPSQEIETNLRPVLRYGIERAHSRTNAAGRRISNEPLVAQRLTRKAHMKEVTHLADYETEQDLGYSLEDETLDPEILTDRGQIDRRMERSEQAGVTSGQTIIHGGIHSLIEQHNRWLEDVQGWSDEERERLG